MRCFLLRQILQVQAQGLETQALLSRGGGLFLALGVAAGGPDFERPVSSGATTSAKASAVA